MSQQAAFQFVFSFSFWMDSVWDKVGLNGPPEQLCKLVTKLIYCSAEPRGEVIRGSRGHIFTFSHTRARTHTHTHTKKNKTHTHTTHHSLLATYTMLCTRVRHDATRSNSVMLLADSQYYTNSTVQRLWSKNNDTSQNNYKTSISWNEVSEIVCFL